MLLKPRQVINECYILQERLGEDSFCELWRATVIYSATQFLLRFLKESPGIAEKAEDFRALAMRSYSVTSAAIVDVVEIEQYGDRFFVSSEFGGHRNLRTVFSEKPRFKLEHACRFAIEIGQGLDAFHKHGLVYGCLNAENVLVRKTGDLVEELRIQKPGYAIFLPLLPEERDSILENYGYMAPEAKAGETADPRSDIYSLGVHLFRFITGRLPYGQERARRGSPSPAFVAKALARRDVPREVAVAVVRSLRRAPEHRQSEVLELIAELRSFVDERRRELLSAGRADPLAELERLNLGKQRVDAIQAVKSLDTADYFRAISLAAPLVAQAQAARGAETLFPVTDFADPAEVDRIEEREAAGEEDDDSLSAESYVERAEREVADEIPSQRPSRLARASGQRSPETSAAAGIGTSATAEAHRAAELAEKARAAASVPVGEFSSDPAPSRRRVSSRIAAPLKANGIVWRRAAAAPLDVVAGMESAFCRAFKGTGAFRLIQEPQPGPDAVAFARVFARFRAKGLVADLGPLASGADATDLLRALRTALAGGIAAESPAARAVLAKRVAALDSIGALSAAPLGALLFGADGDEPDPEIIESREGEALIARLIASLARRRKPLVLSLRGGERIGRSAHDILVELAHLAPNTPMCAFVFYKLVPVPSWNVLSHLAPSGGRELE